MFFGAASQPATPIDDQNLEVISIDYLKRKAEGIVNWAASINKYIFSDKQLRKYLTHLKLS